MSLGRADKDGRDGLDYGALFSGVLQPWRFDCLSILAWQVWKLTLLFMRGDPDDDDLPPLVLTSVA